MSVTFESIFIISIIKKFITEYTADGEIMPERDIMKIYDRYLKTEFLRDFIPIFPITFILDMSYKKYGRIFYLIKIIRLTKGLKFFNVQQTMDYFKRKHEVKVLAQIDKDPALEENLNVDQNNIDYFFNLHYLLKIFKLFLMIMNVSYFTGIIWLIFCQVTHDISHAYGEVKDETGTFYETYEMESRE